MTDKIDQVMLLETNEDWRGHVLVFRVLKSTEPMRAGLVFKVLIARRTQGPPSPTQTTWEETQHASVLRCIWRTAVHHSGRKSGETFEWPEFFAGLES
jgi:hypothetical protein